MADEQPNDKNDEQKPRTKWQLVIELQPLLQRILVVLLLLFAILFFKKEIRSAVAILTKVELFGIKMEFDFDVTEFQNQSKKLIPDKVRFKSVNTRLQRTLPLLTGAKVLWIDRKHPGFNLREREVVRTLGVSVDMATTVGDACRLLEENHTSGLEPYDVVISDSSVWPTIPPLLESSSDVTRASPDPIDATSALSNSHEIETPTATVTVTRKDLAEVLSEALQVIVPPPIELDDVEPGIDPPVIEVLPANPAAKIRIWTQRGTVVVAPKGVIEDYGVLKEILNSAIIEVKESTTGRAEITPQSDIEDEVRIPTASGVISVKPHLEAALRQAVQQAESTSPLEVLFRSINDHCPKAKMIVYTTTFSPTSRTRNDIFGITNRYDELLHLIMDALERRGKDTGGHVGAADDGADESQMEEDPNRDQEAASNIAA